jgi:DNA-binding transcriptional regulator YhcF (GntR family)
MLDAPAFRALSGNAVKLMALLNKRYNGANNGDVAMSVREAAAEVGCSVNHAHKCFRELEGAGFIVPTQRGSFTWKKRHATTWRLTWIGTANPSALSGIDAATKEFMRIAGSAAKKKHGDTA